MEMLPVFRVVPFSLLCVLVGWSMLLIPVVWSEVVNNNDNHNSNLRGDNNKNNKKKSTIRHHRVLANGPNNPIMMAGCCLWPIALCPLYEAHQLKSVSCKSQFYENNSMKTIASDKFGFSGRSFQAKEKRRSFVENGFLQAQQSRRLAAAFDL